MPDTHIKMPDVVPVIRYAANGTQVEFDFPFPVFASEDVTVYLDGARQNSGYHVSGAGQTLGGTVIFDSAPSTDVVVTIERRVALERMTDFLEGGDLSARSLNNEFDALTAGLQQLARDQSVMIRYDGLEVPGQVILPARASRANRALAFDENGDMITVAHGSTLQAPSFVQSGMGAVSRSVTDKVRECVSVRDFGATGDGVTDDTLAIQRALAASGSVYVPPGTYRVTSTIVLGVNQSLRGAGQASIMAASASSFHVIEMRASYATLCNLKITGGDCGLKLYGHSGPCVQNAISDLVISGAKTGVLLDGYNNSSNPCYWNNFERVLVLSPSVQGIRLLKSGAGDTPNANRFNQCRVYSSGAPMTGSGIYIEYGGNANSFTDCEVNVHSGATACVRVGAQASSTFFSGLYTESAGVIDNVRLDAGSAHTSIVNLHAMAAGTAIADASGGSYTAHNAGYPVRSRLQRTSIVDATITLLRHDTVYVDAPGVATLDVSAGRTVHLVAATNGQITLRLPAASGVAGCVYTIKKVDATGNMVVVTALSGAGPDGRDIQLGGPNDYVSVISNGANWYIVSSNRLAGNTRYHDGAGTYDIDMAVDVYLLSAFAGAKTARLPPANAGNAVGRMVHIKKTDTSANAVTVTVQGGGNIDGSSSYSLSSQYKTLSAVSNGAQWYIVNAF